MVTPKNLPRIKVGLPIGFESTVVIVLLSISSVNADVAENIAMNKPDRTSVERPISRSILMSSSIVYMAIEGLKKNKNSEKDMITA
jgi:hypothetical protein